MARSRTQKKFAKKVNPATDQTIGQFTDYIKKWTNHELGKLQTQDLTPVCMPTSNGYRIGLYKITIYPNKTCDLFDHNGEFLFRFEHKISAILYTIYTIKKKYWLADEILACNTEINKSYTDMVTLRHGVEQARKRKDYTTLDIKLSRLELAETKLNHAREQMTRIQRIAKFAKVWE
jgi:hypothetical protein